MIVDALLALVGSILGNTVSGANMFASGATVVSPNSIDVSNGGSGQVRDMAEGEELFARVVVTTSFAGGTSVQFNVVASDDAAGVTNPTIIGSSPVLPVATAIAGYRTAIALNPVLASKGQRYLTLQAVNVGANTAGAIYADIGDGIGGDGKKFYTSGFVVL